VPGLCVPGMRGVYHVRRSGIVTLLSVVDFMKSATGASTRRSERGAEGWVGACLTGLGFAHDYRQQSHSSPSCPKISQIENTTAPLRR
jgi:hypothetical protein